MPSSAKPLTWPYCVQRHQPTYDFKRFNFTHTRQAPSLHMSQRNTTSTLPPSSPPSSTASFLCNKELSSIAAPQLRDCTPAFRSYGSARSRRRHLRRDERHRGRLSSDSPQELQTDERAAARSCWQNAKAHLPTRQFANMLCVPFVSAKAPRPRISVHLFDNRAF